MRRVIPYMIWSAISESTFAGSFVNIISKSMDETTVSRDWSADKKLEISLLALVTLGVGELVGSSVIGRVIDKHG